MPSKMCPRIEVGHHGIEHDRDLRGLHLARAQAAQGALGGDLAYFFGRIQPAQIARDREPVVALHGAVFRLRDGHGGDRTIRAAVLADESVGVGQDFVAGGGVERSAFGILDARVVVERGFLGAAGVVDALFAGQRVHVGVSRDRDRRRASRVARLRECRRRDLQK